MIAEYRDELMGEQPIEVRCVSPGTVNRYLSALGKALSVAVKEWGWIEDTPMRKVSKLQEGSGRDRFLSFEERDKMLAECKKSANQNLYPIVALALIIGMRYGEIVSKDNKLSLVKCDKQVSKNVSMLSPICESMGVEDFSLIKHHGYQRREIV